MDSGDGAECGGAQPTLVLSASNTESKVFYLKMKGDYHRYLAEFKVGDERKAAAEDTMLSYKAAQVIKLPPFTLQSLSLSLLSFTVQLMVVVIVRMLLMRIFHPPTL